MISVVEKWGFGEFRVYAESVRVEHWKWRASEIWDFADFSLFTSFWGFPNSTDKMYVATFLYFQIYP